MNADEVIRRIEAGVASHEARSPVARGTSHESQQRVTAYRAQAFFGPLAIEVVEVPNDWVDDHVIIWASVWGQSKAYQRDLFHGVSEIVASAAVHELIIVGRSFGQATIESIDVVADRIKVCFVRQLPPQTGWRGAMATWRGSATAESVPIRPWNADVSPSHMPRLFRSKIEELLEGDRGPFATARRAAVMAACELAGDGGHLRQLGEARALLAALEGYEAKRGGGRKPAPVAVAWFAFRFEHTRGAAILRAYEGARGMP